MHNALDQLLWKSKLFAKATFGPLTVDRSITWIEPTHRNQGHFQWFSSA